MLYAEIDEFLHLKIYFPGYVTEAIYTLICCYHFTVNETLVFPLLGIVGIST